MIKLIHGDCLEVMRGMPENSIDLILTDPPYYKVKALDWDRQWATADEYLAWLDGVLAEFYRLLKPNGSLYLFASPSMAARVEYKTAERFNVLTNIRWVKDAGWHNKMAKEELRSYLTPSETIIFAEHYGAEGYYDAKCDELRGFIFEPLRAYLAGEFRRAGIAFEKANEFCGTASMAARHYFARSQWCLPTAEHYESLQRGLNASGGEFLRREYEDLRREYEDLRREYEDLRREYEDLRRPFAVTKDVSYTDVWTFKTVAAYPGKHPCEKPLAMIEHIIKASSRKGSVVLDAFCGSGVVGVACVKTGRSFIGIEIGEGYYNIAQKRIAEAQLQPRLFTT